MIPAPSSWIDGFITGVLFTVCWIVIPVGLFLVKRSRMRKEFRGV
jgi:hypothetical protein